MTVHDRHHTAYNPHVSSADLLRYPQAGSTALPRLYPKVGKADVPPDHLEAGAIPPRRRVDRETTPGRCNNLDYCSIGMQRVLVQVPVSQKFICPECSGHLRPPGSVPGLSRAAVLPAARIVVLAAGMTVALGAGYEIGRVQPVVRQAVDSASKAARVELAAARTALLPDAPASPVRTGAATLAMAPILVSEHAFPARAASADTVNPPARLTHEARYGQVTVDCTLGALLTKPSCQVTDTKGSDAFSAAAMNWLQQMNVQYAPGTRSGTAALMDHRWRVTFTDFSGTRRHGAT